MCLARCGAMHVAAPGQALCLPALTGGPLLAPPARPPAKVADPPPLRRRPGVVQGSCGSAPSRCPKASWTEPHRPTI